MVAFHGVRSAGVHVRRTNFGNTRSRPMAKEIRPALTMAACSEASVPPSTATIMTSFQKPPPIWSPTKARMLAPLALHGADRRDALKGEDHERVDEEQDDDHAGHRGPAGLLALGLLADVGGGVPAGVQEDGDQEAGDTR